MKINILYKINKKLFNKLFKNPDKLYNKIVSLLNEYEKELLQQEKIEKLTLETINSKKEYFERKLSKDIVSKINLDSFLNNLRIISGFYKLSEEELRDKIKQRFDDYISTLRQRVIDYYSDNKIELEEKDISEEFSELKELQKQIKTDIKISKRKFNEEKIQLQLELLKMQEWYKKNNEKIAIIFEGRDAAGKGSCISTITEYLDPKYYKISTFGIPTEYEKRNWFERYKKELPKEGNMTLFDRSWYNRAVNDPIMGYCTKQEYKKFMEEVNPFEENLLKQGYYLIKFWFSITKDTQKLRFEMRKANPLKYWKFSENDLEAMNKWEKFTAYKNKMFRKTSTDKSPWIVVESNSKRAAQLNAMRYILKNIPYEGKNENRIGQIYPEIIIPML